MHTHEDALTYLRNWLKTAEFDLQNAVSAVRTALETQDQLDIRRAISEFERLEETRLAVESALRRQITTGGVN